MSYRDRQPGTRRHRRRRREPTTPGVTTTPGPTHRGATLSSPSAPTQPPHPPGLLGRLHGAMALVVREGLKFGVVGAVAFVVDTGLFNLLLHVGEPPLLAGKPLTAKVISVCVATLVAWLGNRYWTFRRRRRSAVPRELVLFAVVNVGGLLLALLPLAVSRYVLGLDSPLADNIAANFVGLALGTAFRFLMYRTVVFTETPGLVDAARAEAQADAAPRGSGSGSRSGPQSG